MQEQYDHIIFDWMRGDWFVISHGEIEIEVCLCVPPNMIDNHAIVLTKDASRQHELLNRNFYLGEDCNKVSITPYIFVPSVLLCTANISEVFGDFASFCNDHNISSIYINGHLNQPDDSEHTGYGCIKYGPENAKIYTIDIFRTL